jgi:peptidase M1-like protein/immune inhibitor InhA-like protein
MFRRIVSAAAVTTVILALTPAASPATGHRYTPGAPGIGDPYYPLDGNGGYDVRDYLLDLRYTPPTDVLEGTATIKAAATQNLSSFNLDLDGLTVRSVSVNGRRATWSHDGGELTITPHRGIDKFSRFTTIVRYGGVPSAEGFGHTDDGAMVLGQPHAATSWFPVNDHPTDKATYTIRLAVPAGLEAVSNGVLLSHPTRHGWTTWTWRMRDPMASYLAMASIGEFDLREYRSDGMRFWDAVDPDLYEGLDVAPRTGERFALSQTASETYKRLARTITVPAGGADLSFWINRDTEQDWDYVFVEAHTVGADDWTTLPDRNGHTADGVGESCPTGWHDLHPFLAHYQTPESDGSCTPSGTTGSWSAATGTSGGYEQWSVDLSDYAGTDVEVAISYVSDWSTQGPGLFVDDIEVSTGAGTTSFEEDGDPLDGWTMPGPPAGSAANRNDWIAGTVDQLPPPPGAVIDASFARQAEILAFLSSRFGRYPFSVSGGVVDDIAIGFALETQSRPVYSSGFFSDQAQGDSVVVHELAHQWFGDNVSLGRWRHIWLNEGFASYAEWLWAEEDGIATVQESFDATYNFFPADDPFWDVIVDDPGPDAQFDSAVYNRGAMTVHQLRLEIGDDAFFRILREWNVRFADSDATTEQFIEFAERVSGRDLDELFTAWLYTPGRPALPTDAAGAPATATAGHTGPLPASVARTLKG